MSQVKVACEVSVIVFEAAPAAAKAPLQLRFGNARIIRKHVREAQIYAAASMEIGITLLCERFEQPSARR